MDSEKKQFEEYNKLVNDFLDVKYDPAILKIIKDVAWRIYMFAYQKGWKQGRKSKVRQERTK